MCIWLFSDMTINKDTKTQTHPLENLSNSTSSLASLEWTRLVTKSCNFVQNHKFTSSNPNCGSKKTMAFVKSYHRLSILCMHVFFCRVFNGQQSNIPDAAHVKEWTFPLTVQHLDCCFWFSLCFPHSNISITHHYWPEYLAAGPAPWSAGQSDARTAKRLGPVSWTPLKHTQTQRDTHIKAIVKGLFLEAVFAVRHQRVY